MYNKIIDIQLLREKKWSIGDLEKEVVYPLEVLEKMGLAFSSTYGNSLIFKIVNPSKQDKSKEFIFKISDRGNFLFKNRFF